ncbi:MAG: Stp1/IreP family PP2C-type Ser/Thr phosphatase [Deltaproteobacteria bacterium]|nr:Stp1/IreP family PP2C-type Ser/Thr phosphatase [Deltaproteobacteria bacterium]
MNQKIFSGKTDIGRKRSNNEDQFIIHPKLEFCVAADGMGGAAAGEIASSIFVETALEVFKDPFKRSENEVLFHVKKAFSLANEKILAHINKNPNHEGMGCTAELLAFYDDGFVLGHVGDSRTYLLRGNHLRQITQDHTLVQQQVEESIISPDRAKNHPLRNVILRALGQKRELAVDLLRGKIFSRDLFLLCSDGLTDMVGDDQIEELLLSNLDIETKAKKLVETANNAGGADNITAVLVTIQ